MELAWRSGYFTSVLTPTRKALLDRLAFTSLERAQKFALDRLQEGNWVTRDRQHLIDLLTTKPGPTSHKFILASMRNSALHWFTRIAGNLTNAAYDHLDLAPILIEQMKNNRYSEGRLAAIRLLSGQKSSKDLVCRELAESLVNTSGAEQTAAVSQAMFKSECTNDSSK